MTRVCRLFVVMLLAAGPALAQSAPAAKDTKAADQKGEQPRPVLQPPQPTQNVRLDLTITDQRGEGTALTKTMTVTVVDSGMGRIRTNGEVRTPMGSRSVI